jgi:hypothetical protein
LETDSQPRSPGILSDCLCMTEGAGEIGMYHRHFSWALALALALDRAGRCPGSRRPGCSAKGKRQERTKAKSIPHPPAPAADRAGGSRRRSAQTRRHARFGRAGVDLRRMRRGGAHAFLASNTSRSCWTKLCPFWAAKPDDMFPGSGWLVVLVDRASQMMLVTVDEVVLVLARPLLACQMDSSYTGGDSR